MTLNVRESGRGDCLVILHGLFGDLDNFASVALHLDRHLKVCRLDLPGHGHSETLSELSITGMAQAVADTLQQRGISRYALLGHSLGGKVAMCVAGMDNQQDITHLLIEDIAPRQYPPHHAAILEALQSLDLSSLAHRRDADTLLRDTIPDAGVRAFLLKALTRESGAANFSWRFDLAGLARDYSLLCEAPVVQHKVSCPTLFIKGGNSDYLSRSDEPAIRKLFSQPALKEIGGAGHWPHAEKPAVFAKLCLDFIRTEQPQKTA